jgi:hypothetical protein
VIALGAFEQSVFETNWPRRNAFQHHSRLAMRTARALNSRQELLGYGHDDSLRWAGALPTPCHRWLQAPSPAAAPSASPSAATSKESNDKEKQDRTDGSVDDCADHSRTEMDAELRQ